MLQSRIANCCSYVSLATYFIQIGHEHGEAWNFQIIDLGQLSGSAQLDNFNCIKSFHSRFVETEVLVLKRRIAFLWTVAMGDIHPIAVSTLGGV